jgi:3-hydroxy-3-methylglutaryl CoA synthase
VAGSPSFRESLDYVIYHTPVLSLVRQAHHLLMEASGDDIDYDELAADFESRVEPALRYLREVGNIYSGGLYVALIGLIESISNLEPGTRIGSFSYGSGSCAEFFSGRVRDGARELVAAKRIGDQLARRRRLSMEEYEAAVLVAEQVLVEAEFEPNLEEPAGHYQKYYQGKRLLVLDRVSDHHRRYRWSEGNGAA